MSLSVMLMNMYEYVEKNQDENAKQNAKQIVSICSEFSSNIAQPFLLC